MRSFILILAAIALNINSLYAAPEEMPDGSGVGIAVIDTGVMAEYAADMKDHIEEGMNYVFPEDDTDDKIGHGTRVVSIIIGAEAKGSVVMGTASGGIVVPLVYQSRYSSGVVVNGGTELLAKAITDSVDIYGCRVLCISSGTAEDSEVLRKAVAHAEENGAVIVAAVGNDNLKYPDKVYYPAAYETVIGIGAIDKKNAAADFSQRNGVFAVEEGKDVAALSSSGEVKKYSGTSYANARAAGIIAGLLSRYSGSTPEEIRSAIAMSAYDLGEQGYDDDYGWGKINIFGAIEILQKFSVKK
ncbi:MULTISPECIES: S8 family peptidase [unclassified Sedimentibacter]|uniref:S8 family peptidase n=1 Tax=unclassified Sedimentibacter TaxID=2649220 RepID=UPI0027DF8F0F|nr:S8 family serine peptidase [Sedimentibacter sp. MB35-C1]WMJ78239.1 S8 family serine peptidase [Sedimentibacter sp. MB35-C1]